MHFPSTFPAILPNDHLIFVPFLRFSAFLLHFLRYFFRSVALLRFQHSVFLFKLALKQFYDTISTKQINSLVTAMDRTLLPLMPTAFIMRPVGPLVPPPTCHTPRERKARI